MVFCGKSQTIKYLQKEIVDMAKYNVNLKLEVKSQGPAIHGNISKICEGGICPPPGLLLCKEYKKVLYEGKPGTNYKSQTLRVMPPLISYEK